MHWDRDCLEKFPESLVFDTKQNEIWSPKEKLWNNIDLTEARDKA